MSKPTTDALLAALRTRRTVYPLTKTLTTPAARIREIVAQAVQHVPTSFNLQTNRAVVLLGAEHDKLWDEARGILRGIVTDEEKWKSTASRMDLFRNAAGTVLFFKDEAPITAAAPTNPYGDRMPHWANESLGMIEWVAWTALELEGLGANLQHYNPLIDDKVREHWGVPETWKLDAQLVFGGRGAEPAEKVFGPQEDRVKVFGDA